MEKKEMLSAMIEHYTGGNKARFAAKLGITPQAINSWEKRNTFDTELIFAKCEGINARWLLKGEGEMIASRPDNQEKFIDHLLRIIREKDSTIRELSERIGALNEKLSLAREIS